METCGMTNAENILSRLDEKLISRVDITLYGRAALHLGFPNAPEDHALSRDVDAVLWLGQAEDLNDKTNFWEAIESVNEELAERDLYISHFFTEDQVILRPDWHKARIPINRTWPHLDLHRLGNVDLLLSKLMRDDPIDRSYALFIVHASGLSRADIERAINEARIPDVEEIHEQFVLATKRLLSAIPH
jgi:hypothetical protein